MLNGCELFELRNLLFQGWIHNYKIRNILREIHLESEESRIPQRVGSCPHQDLAQARILSIVEDSHFYVRATTWETNQEIFDYEEWSKKYDPEIYSAEPLIVPGTQPHKRAEVQQDPRVCETRMFGENTREDRCVAFYQLSLAPPETNRMSDDDNDSDSDGEGRRRLLSPQIYTIPKGNKNKANTLAGYWMKAMNNDPMLSMSRVC